MRVDLKFPTDVAYFSKDQISLLRNQYKTSSMTMLCTVLGTYVSYHVSNARWHKLMRNEKVTTTISNS